MGVDLSYQAIPEGTGLIRRIEASREDWDALFWEVLPWGSRPSSEVLAQPEVQRWLQRMAEPRTWRHDLRTRGQEQLAWVIQDREPIFGEAPIAPHVKSGQGFTLRMTTSAGVRRGLDTLNGMTEAELRVRFDPAAMVAAGLYKSSVSDTFEPLWADLCALREFYRSVADAGFAVVVSLW